MKFFLPFIFLTASICLTASASFAAPVKVHNRIVYTTPTSPQNTAELVWTMDSQGRHKKLVWHVPSSSLFFGEFSGDGKRALTYGNGGISIYDLTSSAVHEVKLGIDRTVFSIEKVQFSARENEVLGEIGVEFPEYRTLNDPKPKLLKIKFGAGTPDSITEVPRIIPKVKGGEPGGWSFPLWSPDGTQNAATFSPWQNPHMGRKGQTLDYGSLWIANADGTQARQLAPTQVKAFHPAWSRDGKQIAFLVKSYPPGSNPFGLDEVWLADLKSGTEKPLTFGDSMPVDIEGQSKFSRIYALSFAPNGRQILFQRNDSIRSIDIDGKNEHQLAVGRLVQWVN